jgi:hypothetical protein
VRAALEKLAEDLATVADMHTAGPLAANSSAGICLATRAAANNIRALLAAHPEPDTAYRSGLPSVEQVRAHEAAGGAWQIFAHGPCARIWPISEQYLKDWLDEQPWLLKARWRPCSADGTPVDWSTLTPAVSS